MGGVREYHKENKTEMTKAHNSMLQTIKAINKAMVKIQQNKTKQFGKRGVLSKGELTTKY